MRRLLLGVLLTVGCAAPLPVHREEWVLGRVAGRFHEFYPPGGDPDARRDAALLRPRFGLPAIVQAGAEIPIAILERGAPPAAAAALIRGSLADAEAEQCLGGNSVDGCWPLDLARGTVRAIADGVDEVRIAARPRTAPPPGPYDLYVRSPVDRPTRAPRAVWLLADDPATREGVRVVQLNDLHVGKHVGHLDDNLRAVIFEINRLAPDLVIVTGDLSNLGTEASQAVDAQRLLRTVRAPVVVVLGNHDLGFDSFTRAEYGPGWSNFARAFHSYLFFDFTLGDWQFIGFDSGPSTFSPRILTRGLLPESVAHVGNALAEAKKAGRRGVVLFSHAPSRATVSGDGPGPFGRMKHGAAELERVFLDESGEGFRVLHLAGHTHWSDVFESDGGTFRRWRQLSPCPRSIKGKAALITTQAAAHSGLTFKETAHGWGFTELALDGGAPVLTIHRYGLPDDPWVCREQPLATR